MGQRNNADWPDTMPEYNYSSFDLDDDGASGHFSDTPIIDPNENAGPPNIGGDGNNRVIRQRKWSLLLYSITTVLLFADQNLLAPNLSQAAEEFGFDDDERDKKLGGDIALAFFILGAPASFLVGCGADSDSISRSLLFGIIVLIGEGACFLTYFTTTYTGLYITRAFTGFSVGGALPLLSSVLGDWYEPQERGKVMASIGIGTGVGISLGQGIAGVFGPTYGWRLPFLIISVPALFVAVLVITTVVDPVRGGSENISTDLSRQLVDDAVRNEEVEERTQRSSSSSPLEAVASSEEDVMDGMEPLELRTYKSKDNDDNHGNDESGRSNSFLAVFKPSSYTQHLVTTKELLTSKTVILTLLQGAPGCIPWGIVNTFLNDYLAQDCGMGVRAATATILVFGVGNFFGIVAGGAGGDYLYKMDYRYPSLLSGTMAIVGCFPLWILINTTNVGDGELTLWMALRIVILALLAGIGSGVTGPIVKATLQNTTLPNARGQAFALLNTFDDFGRGLGPVFVASLIIGLGGRKIAFNVGVGGWVLCGLINLCIFFTVKDDVSKTHKVFLERHSNASSLGSDSKDN